METDKVLNFNFFFKKFLCHCLSLVICQRLTGPTCLCCISQLGVKLVNVFVGGKQKGHVSSEGDFQHTFTGGGSVTTCKIHLH